MSDGTSSPTPNTDRNPREYTMNAVLEAPAEKAAATLPHHTYSVRHLHAVGRHEAAYGS